MITGLPLNNIPKGLSTEEVTQLLAKHGENKFPELPPPTNLEIFASQLKSPLVYILLSAGVVTTILTEYADTAIISVAVLLNTILGYIQERKANHALVALKKMILPFAEVLRDGQVQNVAVSSIVPGDVVFVDQGDKIPADGQVMASNRFYVSEAILTGESVPIEKKVNDKVFMGTIVTGGKTAFLVEKTGASTEMGKIAMSVSTVGGETPLGRQLKVLSKEISRIVFFLLLIVFSIGIITGKDSIEIFKTSVAMAVSAIPEGLLVALTVVLAIGMQRILKRKGLVRNLKSAETLGGVTTICVDKTGTLTEGKMKVVEIYGDEKLLAEQVILANDLDDPIVIAAWEWGLAFHDNVEEFKNNHERVDSIPFDSNLRIYACLDVSPDGGRTIFINGAPEEVLRRCELDEFSKNTILNKITELSSKGIRVLGFARKAVETDKTYLYTEDTYENYKWVGLLGFFDPVREDVKSAFEITKSAGIKLIVITGDYANTAMYVVNQMGYTVKDSDIIAGDHLAGMSDEELKQKLSIPSEIKIFARTRPDQKLRIVEVLKNLKEVVAMMGDGVNDAPALSKADIGIVVGEASDVAKESSDLVLLDSRFSTIVAAIEEGRGIFDNIRKIILYLMCDAYVEIFLVLTTMLMGLPLPLTAAQILWINIVSDGLPHLALTVDPKVAGLMRRRPRSPNEPLVSEWIVKLILLVSLVGSLFAVSVYVLVLKSTNDYVLARSVTFATVLIKSLVYVFSVRTLQNSFWQQNPFSNRWLLLAVGVGTLLAVIPFFDPTLQSFLKVVPLGSFWIYPIVSSLLTFLIIEIGKKILGKKLDGARLALSK